VPAGRLRGRAGRPWLTRQTGAETRLFGLAAFTDPVDPADRRWPGGPGTALIELAFDGVWPC